MRGEGEPPTTVVLSPLFFIHACMATVVEFVPAVRLDSHHSDLRERYTPVNKRAAVAVPKEAHGDLKATHVHEAAVRALSDPFKVRWRGLAKQQHVFLRSHGPHEVAAERASVRTRYFGSRGRDAWMGSCARCGPWAGE